MAAASAIRLKGGRIVERKTKVLIALAAMAALGGTAAVTTLAVARPEERQYLLDQLAKLGWPAKEVNAVINFESGWRPGIINRISQAVGLIQFMPFTLKTIGFGATMNAAERVAAMARLSAREQVPWVVKFFQSTGKRWRLPGDTYLAVAAPGFVGARDEVVIYPVGSKAWQQNPAWRSDADGPITAGSIRRIILRKV